MAVEDFTTYTEVDPAGDITVTATRCDVVTMEAGVEAYVRKDKGAAFFGEFEHRVTAHIGTGDPYGMWCPWGLSNGSSTYVAMGAADEGVMAFLYRTSLGEYKIYLVDFTNDNAEAWLAAANTTYYLTIERSGTTLTCKIYSDSARANLLNMLSIVCGADTYRYIFAVASWDRDAFTDALSGYVENLDLEPSIVVGGYAGIF